MKFKYLFIFFFLVFVVNYGCTNNSNSPEFMKKAKSRYLYNSDEVIHIYFKEREMYLAEACMKKLLF